MLFAFVEEYPDVMSDVQNIFQTHWMTKHIVPGRNRPEKEDPMPTSGQVKKIPISKLESGLSLTVFNHGGWADGR